MTSEKKEGGLSAALKWAPLLLSFVTTVSTLAVLYAEKPGVFKSAAVSVSAVGATLIWLFLLNVCLKKRSSDETSDTRQPAFSTRVRILALAGLLILPSLAGVVAHIVSQPPQRKPPPSDKLAVAVAGFTFRSSALADTANEIVGFLKRELSKDKEVLSVCKCPEKQMSQPEPDRAAKEFGQLNGAHLVVWGEVISVGEAIQVVPTVTAAYEWRSNDTTGDERANFTPDLAAVFKPTAPAGLNKQTADFARLLTGAAYYKAKNWEKAVEFFNAPDNEESLLWLGLSYHRYAREVREPDERVRGLNQALQSYHTLIDKARGTSAFGSPLTLAEALFMSGDAFQELAEIGLMAEKSHNLRLAEDAYEESRQAYQQIGSAIPWQLHNNLGVALTNLAAMGEGNSIDYFNRAEAAYHDGLDVVDELTEAAAYIHSNRGGTLAKWALLPNLPGSPDRDKLEKAKIDLEAPAFNLLTSKHPLLASARKNLANVLADLANLTPTPGDDRLRRDAIDLYNEKVLPAYGDLYGRASVEYALAEKSLAETYYDRGEKLRDAESLRNARRSYDHAIEALRGGERPDELADTQLFLGKTLVRLCELRAGQPEVQAAVANLQASKAFYITTNSTAETQQARDEIVRAHRCPH